jgi:hypothetical protein
MVPLLSRSALETAPVQAQHGVVIFHTTMLKSMLNTQRNLSHEYVELNVEYTT